MSTTHNTESTGRVRSLKKLPTRAVELTPDGAHLTGGTAGPAKTLAAVVFAVLAALMVASCSARTSGAPTSMVAAGGSPSSSSNAPQPLVRTIGKTGWWDGFAITVDKATLAPNGAGGDLLSLEVTYLNLTQHNATPATGSLQVGGQVVNSQSDPPTVPGSGTAKATITAAELPASTDFAAVLDSAVLTYGQASDNQTKIPLSTSATVDSTQPKTLTVTGKLVQGQIDVDALSGTLAPSYQSGEKGQMTLDLRVKLTCSMQCSTAGNYIPADAFSLTAPGGTSVVADSRSPYRTVSLDPGEVSDNSQNVLVFVVSTPGTGTYVLTYNANLADAATPPATLQFTA
jgi:hypothetical protein